MQADADQGLLYTADQLRRARERLDYAARHVPFYRERFREAGFDPADVQSYADFASVPTITKAEVIADQEACPPFGTQLAVDAGELRRIFCNAGSLYLWFTAADLDALAEMFSAQFAVMGVQRGDVVDISSTFHWLMAGTNMDVALRRLDATVVPGGPGMSELRAKLFRELGVTVLEAFTPYAEELASRFGDYGIDPERDLQMRLLLIGGELRQAEARARLQAAWGGAAVREFYGASEAGMVAAECFEAGDGMHLSDDVLVEVIDPETGEHVPPGDGGEVVTTELYRTAQRFVRYRTGDITAGVDFGPCVCGRTTPRLRRILGRNSEIARVKGLFVSPAVVRQVVAARAAEARWQVLIDRPVNLDRMTLRVESDVSGDVREALRRDLVHDVKGSIGLTCDVELVGVGSMPVDLPPIADARTFGGH